jgi:hypothetical protein
MKGFIPLLVLAVIICIFPAKSFCNPRNHNGGGDHHGSSTDQTHHGASGCHMERTDRRSVSSMVSGSMVAHTSTHSQCQQEVLKFQTGCDSVRGGCFLGVSRQASGESYSVLFDQLQTPNETHLLKDFAWNSMACNTQNVDGVSGVFCTTSGSKMVEGRLCHLQWSSVLPVSGMMTTPKYSCRPDTIKVDMQFSSCIAESLTLHAVLTGPEVDTNPRLMPEESFNGVMEQGLRLQDDHTYFSWVQHANSVQMPVSAVSTASNGTFFTILSRNSSLVTWDPKLAASNASILSSMPSIFLFLMLMMLSFIL